MRRRAWASLGAVIVLSFGTVVPTLTAAAQLFRGADLTGGPGAAADALAARPVVEAAQAVPTQVPGGQTPDGQTPGGAAPGGQALAAGPSGADPYAVPGQAAANPQLPGLQLPGTQGAVGAPTTVPAPGSMPLAEGGPGGVVGPTLPTETIPYSIDPYPTDPVPPGTGSGSGSPPVDLPPGTTSGQSAAVLHNWGAPARVDNFDNGLAQWNLYNGPGHAGNGVRSPAHATVANSVLTINGDASGTTEGMAWNFGSRYGRWEGRMRAPASDPSYNALFLLWPDAEDFPVGGEIDFAEMSDSTRQKTEFFLHYGQSNSQVSGAVRVDATQWHNWAVEWAPTGVTAYVDGQAWYHTDDQSILPPRSMHMTIQLDWFPKGGAVTPSQMNVDWVAFYPLTGSGAGSSPISTGGGPTVPPVVTPSQVVPPPVTTPPVTTPPVTRAPVTTAPVTRAPVTKAPVTKAPVTKAPVTTNAPAPTTSPPAPTTPPPTTPPPTTTAAVTTTPAPTTRKSTTPPETTPPA